MQDSGRTEKEGGLRAFIDRPAAPSWRRPRTRSKRGCGRLRLFESTLGMVGGDSRALPLSLLCPPCASLAAMAFACPRELRTRAVPEGYSRGTSQKVEHTGHGTPAT